MKTVDMLQKDGMIAGWKNAWNGRKKEVDARDETEIA